MLDASRTPRDVRPEVAALDGCPDDAALLALAEGAGAEPARLHIADCSRCRRAVAAFAELRSAVSGSVSVSVSVSLSVSVSVSVSIVAESDDDALSALDRLRAATSFRASLVPGARLGRYVVRALAGRGAMGQVYAAYDPQLDRAVALKLMHPVSTAATRGRSPAGDAQAARLLREARALAKLTHPNVVSVYDVGVHEQLLFIAMEYVEGTTLSEWLGGEPRLLRDVIRVFVETGKGLAAAHAAGIVHRDVKPDNVLLARGGQAKVTDFGLARGPWRVEGPSLIRSGAGDGETQSGAVLGTPAYMSPEQRRGEVIDARSDQYSFCVALHEALVGVRPGRGAPGKGPGRTTRGERLPRRLGAALRRGLETSPAARFESMSLLLDELHRSLEPRVGPRARVALTMAGAGAVALGGLLVATVHTGHARAAVPSDGPLATASAQTPLAVDALRAPLSAVPAVTSSAASASASAPASASPPAARPSSPRATSATTGSLLGRPAPPSKPAPSSAASVAPPRTADAVDAFHERYE